MPAIRPQRSSFVISARQGTQRLGIPQRRAERQRCIVVPPKNTSLGERKVRHSYLDRSFARLVLRPLVHHFPVVRWPFFGSRIHKRLYSLQVRLGRRYWLVSDVRPDHRCCRDGHDGHPKNLSNSVISHLRSSKGIMLTTFRIIQNFRFAKALGPPPCPR